MSLSEFPQQMTLEPPRYCWIIQCGRTLKSVEYSMGQCGRVYQRYNHAITTMVTGTPGREESLNICPTSMGSRQYENFKEFKRRIQQTLDSKTPRLSAMHETTTENENPMKKSKRRNTSLQKQRDSLEKIQMCLKELIPKDPWHCRKNR